MTQLSNDCFKHSKKRISLEEALSILEKRIKCIKKTQKIKLVQALNRILSKDVISKINVPPFNNTAVDGYAFNYLDLNNNSDLCNNIINSNIKIKNKNYTTVY